MLARALRIIKRYPRQTIAVCEACAAQFSSYLPQQDQANGKSRFDSMSTPAKSGRMTLRPNPQGNRFTFTRVIYFSTSGDRSMATVRNVFMVKR
jgi:hypothetical protein